MPPKIESVRFLRILREKQLQRLAEIWIQKVLDEPHRAAPLEQRLSNSASRAALKTI